MCSPFIAIHGQWAQLLQVALLPAVGASMKCLPGAAMRITSRRKTIAFFLTLGVVRGVTVRSRSVLGTIGWQQFADYGDPVGYAQNETGEGQTIWICKPFDGEAARAGNGIMGGFDAACQNVSATAKAKKIPADWISPDQRCRAALRAVRKLSAVKPRD